jgi:hypothetical protein
MGDQEEVQFDSAATRPICGGAIPVPKMEVTFVSRYVCPQCGSDVVIQGEARCEIETASNSSPITSTDHENGQHM